MRDFDYSAAPEFLGNLFKLTEQAVEVRALPNDRGAGPSRSIFTRDPELVIHHCTRWDVIDRAIYHGMCTRLNGSHSGTRADLAELAALWCDIDAEKHGLTKEQVIAAVMTMPLPPSCIVDSGGGIHCYWLLNEAIDVRVDAPDNMEEAIVAVLKQLAGVLAGDLAVCDLARIMRLPGTHNTKTGEMRPTAVLQASWARYEFADIVDMLDTLRPVLTLPERADRPAREEESNPYLEIAKKYGFKPPIDVQERLERMTYMADGDDGIHQTQLHCSASLVSLGRDDDEIVKMLIAATQNAAGAYAHTWNWKREERNIAQMIAGARKKFAESDEKKPAPKPTPAPVAATAGNTALASVTSIKDEREKREQAKPQSPPRPDDDDNDKRPVIPRAGDAVIEVWTKTRGQIAVVGGQPYTYSQGIWKPWDKSDLHALKVHIQGILATSKIDPKTQLLNGIARYVIERPELMRENIVWNDSGLIICLDGAINPLTREICDHSPDHWATARIEINVADMDQGCPQWLAFLNSCFSDLPRQECDAVLMLLAEWFGAAMVPNKARELRKALWLYGESRTGKTRIAEVLRKLVGEPTCSLKLRALEKNFGGQALIGKRAWIADDAIGSADEIDDALFKVIVTGEPFETDVKNKEHETLRLSIPVLFTSNPLPRVKDQSDAVFNRAMLIHMRVVRSEEETAGVRAIDEIVGESELAGVFAWALDGWARLSARGRFLQPTSMLEAADEFKAANNIVGTWARECVEVAPDRMVDRRDTYASFRGWYLTEYGETAKPPSPKFLMTTLRQVAALQPDKKLKGWPCVNGIMLTATGLAYRKELGLVTGTTAGSGCGGDDVNKHTVASDDDVAAAKKNELPPAPDKNSKKPRF